MKSPLFHIGQAVVAIGQPGAKAAPRQGESFPKRGDTYHVRENRLGMLDGKVVMSIMLVEIVNPPIRHRFGRLVEVAFPQECFVPIEMLLPDEALAELLSETLEPVTA